MRVVGKNVLVLDNDPHVRPPGKLVMYGVHAVDASVDDPVAANDYNVHVYRPILTVVTTEYSNGQKEIQQLSLSAKKWTIEGNAQHK